MGIGHFAGIAISLFALVSGLILLARIKEWHLGTLAGFAVLVPAVMVVYHGSLVLVLPDDWGVARVEFFDTFNGLIASALALMAVFFLERMVAERRGAERALRLPEFSIERAAIGVFWIGRDGRLLFVNEAACHRLGYSREELLSRSIQDIDPAMSVEAWAAHWAALKRQGALTYEAEQRDKAGRTFPVDITANFIEFDGEEYNCAFARDISERKQVEQELREATARAEAASKAKTEFLASVSHELRTPLNAIIGFSETMRLQLFGPLGGERYQGYADDIHYSAVHLLGIINGILDLSKAAAGQLKLEDDVVDIRLLAEQCLGMFREEAARHSVELAIRSRSDGPVVRLDARLISQVLINLLSNAIKFTEPGGRVDIAVGLADDGRVRLAVADTGIGIAKHHIAKVMEPFMQADEPFSRRYEGSGLGLPLVRKFVEMHDGEVELDSTPGVGTTVSVLLPATRVVEMAEDAGRRQIA